MVASGCAGLGYQIVWTQQCSLWLGHEAAAVLAVVTAFFGGLALGGLALGSCIEKSEKPLRWYVGCELAIAVWGLVLVFAGSPFSGFVAGATGAEPAPLRQWAVAFLATFALFLPATAAMGATLPAMERLTLQLRREGRSIAALYASNTFGAVLGVLVVAFWLVPTVGLARSALVCIGLNAACAVVALAVFPKTTPVAPSTPVVDPVRALSVLARLAATGFLGIGYEVVVVRALSQVTEDTVYTFAALLAVYLVGTAAGAAAYRRWLDVRRRRKGLGDRLLAALSLACLLGAGSLFAAELVRDGARDALGSGVSAAIAAEATLALLAFGLPTVAMGALFSHLSRAASETGTSFGRALGVNVLAAAAAPALAGVVAVPALGSKLALAVIALGYLALTARRAWLTSVVWVPAASALAFAVLAPPLTFVDVPSGGRIVTYEEGVMAAVSVVEDGDGALRLRINNRQQEGSSATRYTDARQAWLPLLLHPAPRSALFLGLGTGFTASSAAEDRSLAVVAVELLPEVVRASRHFTREASDAAATPRLHVVTADARRYVRTTDRRFDVIVSDNFHPARSGSGALYTVEHFEAVRRRLDPHGVFCQWLPLHQLELETLQSIVRSFTAVYPQSFAMLATNSLETPVIGLVGRVDEERFDVAELQNRLSHAAL
ncbi:MAG TPA: fused MFS/spermidine synthase, partial [Polyangiaceae bacterium]|nr:fused MFS/spermidine synthase [Polyangiaceae bacterium]